MCDDMTGRAIMAGRLGTSTFGLPLAGIFLVFWAEKLFITHTCNERNHRRQIEGHSQPKLQFDLPSQLGNRQTLKSAESQHVKQNKLSTCQLFTNSKHSLSIFTEQTKFVRYLHQLTEGGQFLCNPKKSGGTKGEATISLDRH